MHTLRKLIFVVILYASSVSFAQSELSIFLDSLDQAKLTYFEKRTGGNVIAEKLRKDVDTTQFTIEQVNTILEYQNHAYLKPDDYPFPLLQWALSTSRKLSYTDGEIKSINGLALAKRMNVPHLDEHLPHYQEVLQMYKSMGDVEGEIITLSNMGLTHMSNREYDKALSIMFDVLELRQQNGQKEQLTSTFHNIGDIYRELKDTTNAIKFIKKSIRLEKQFPQYSIRAMNYGFLGEIYSSIGKTDSAFYYLQESNKLIEEHGVVPYLTVYNLNYLGFIQEKNNQNADAYKLYKQAFAIAYTKDTKSIHQILIFGTKMAEFLLSTGKTKETIELLHNIENKKIKTSPSKSIELMHKWLIDFYRIFAKAHEQEKNFVKANEYYKSSIQSTIKYNSLELTKNASELEKKYQSEIDTQNIALLKKQNDIKQRNFVIALLGVIGSICLLLLVFFYYKQRSKQLIIEKHQVEEKVRVKISADLHDDVGSLLTGLAMQSEILGKNAPENISKKLERVSDLSRSAMLKMRDAVWVMDARKDNWQSLIDRINEFASEHLGAKELVYKLEQSNTSSKEEIEGATRQHLYLIAKEAIANILKHSNANTVHIDMTKSKNEIVLSIKDNGKVGNQGNAGLGVSNMKQRILDLNGQLDIKTSDGYEVLIKVPA